MRTFIIMFLIVAFSLNLEVTLEKSADRVEARVNIGMNLNR